MHCSEFKVKQQKWTFVISYDKKLGYFKEEIKNNIETQRVKKWSVHTEFSLYEIVEVLFTTVQCNEVVVCAR